MGVQPSHSSTEQEAADTAPGMPHAVFLGSQQWVLFSLTLETMPLDRKALEKSRKIQDRKKIPTVLTHTTQWYEGFPEVHIRNSYTFEPSHNVCMVFILLFFIHDNGMSIFLFILFIQKAEKQTDNK